MGTDDDDAYKLKKIRYTGKDVCIVLQNLNGPCPLIGIANVLLLRGDVSIPQDHGQIKSARLLELVSNHILERTKHSTDENLKYSVSEAIDALPRMQYGLNVNIRFNDVEGFEYMSDSTVFDVLGIRLLHGWLLDANDEETLRVIGNSAYNQLAERLVEASENEQQASWLASVLKH
ncbi:hypothetical protein CYMTET_5286 [Cymbomonas tetramitiformis]|uniref:MINDY deubiquitinase domain-containing protein n=1 Tax=Cymbomonas tetramitiformis TaxID=36881 RepID=A0AAE0LJ82_9CHLO|nr:hypothetical protein CYMTET_5286 [Cymbomonas tetramitiformis]